CNAVASTFGVLGMVARKYAHRIPFIVKVNHNQLMTYPSAYEQALFGTIDEAYDMGAVAVGATIYFGHPDSNRQIVEIAEAFAYAHELGMATVLWCYTRNDAFKQGGKDYHAAADLTGQANHLGVTIQADIVKQKLPDSNHGFKAVGFGRTHERMYEELMPDDHPIELVRWQVANSYMGRAGLINSGGAAGGANDYAEAVLTAVLNKRGGGMGLISCRKAVQRPMAEVVRWRDAHSYRGAGGLISAGGAAGGATDYAEAVPTAVLNKRGGGMGLISGRKAFQRTMAEGVKLLNLVQDVYLDDSIPVA